MKTQLDANSICPLASDVLLSRNILVRRTKTIKQRNHTRIEIHNSRTTKPYLILLYSTGSVLLQGPWENDLTDKITYVLSVEDGKKIGEFNDEEEKSMQGLKNEHQEENYGVGIKAEEEGSEAEGEG